MSRDYKVRPIRLSKEEDDAIVKGAEEEQRTVADYMRISSLDRAGYKKKPTKKAVRGKKGAK